RARGKDHQNGPDLCRPRLRRDQVPREPAVRGGFRPRAAQCRQEEAEGRLMWNAVAQSTPWLFSTAPSSGGDGSIDRAIGESDAHSGLGRYRGYRLLDRADGERRPISRPRDDDHLHPALPRHDHLWPRPLATGILRHQMREPIAVEQAAFLVDPVW